MTDFATALRQRLIDDAQLGALVGQAFHWTIAPQGAGLPYVRMQTISDPRPETLKDYDAARVTRVQCDCFASTYGSARAIAEGVIAAVAQPATSNGIQFGRVKAEGPRDLGEDVDGVGFIHRMSVDLLINHRDV